MTAVFKRELRAFFVSPLGYVFVGAVFACSGYYFFTGNLQRGSADMTSLFASLFMAVLYLVPVLTMRLMSEDRHLRTDQVLFTAPVSRGGIVLGKYFAALVVYATAISGTLIVAAVLGSFAAVQWAAVIGSFVGLLLLGMALIAACMFVSSFTESQFIAAIAGVGVSLLLTLIEPVALWINSPAVQSFCRAISFNRRYLPFAMGMLELSGAVFFLSVSTLFLGLAAAVLEKRRWS